MRGCGVSGGEKGVLRKAARLRERSQVVRVSRGERWEEKRKGDEGPGREEERTQEEEGLG